VGVGISDHLEGKDLMALEGQCGGLPKVPNLHVLIRLP
jgi:hypothetical protein